MEVDYMKNLTRRTTQVIPMHLAFGRRQNPLVCRSKEI